MRTKATLAVMAAFAATAVFVAACADLFGFKNLTEGEASVPDGTAPDAGADVTECDSATWPSSPPSSEGLDAGQFTFALAHIYLATTADGGMARLGYNLDGHCTVDPSSESCIPPDGGQVVDDDPNGVDDESVHLLNTLTQLGAANSLKDSFINASIASGDFTILMRLYGYTGTQNQTSQTGLSFAVQGSTGIQVAPAKFDGTDRWFPAAQDVVNGTSGSGVPTLLTTSVYVSGGTLVATYASTVVLRFLIAPGGTLSGPMLITLSHPVVTATIVPRMDGNYDLTNGVLAGRWAIADMIGNIGQLQVNNMGPLCTFQGGGSFAAVTSTICPNRDVSTGAKDDGTETCDGISVAIGFDATSASIATPPGVFPSPSATCPDAAPCH